MNVEQHEHRIQGIIADTCRELGVRMESTTALDENGHLCATNGCDLWYYRRRTICSNLVEAIGGFVGSVIAAMVEPDCAAIVVGTAYALATLFIIHAIHLLHAPMPSIDDVQNRIAKRLTESGYTVLRRDGITHVTWQ